MINCNGGLSGSQVAEPEGGADLLEQRQRDDEVRAEAEVARDPATKKHERALVAHRLD